MVEEGDQVADDVEDGVGGWVGGDGGVAVAAEVGGQRAEAAGGERGHLVAPGEPQLREAVDEEDCRPGGGATLGDVEGDAVDVRGPVPHLAGPFGLHAWLLCSPRYASCWMSQSNKNRRMAQKFSSGNRSEQEKFPRQKL